MSTRKLTKGILVWLCECAAYGSILWVAGWKLFLLVFLLTLVQRLLIRSMAADFQTMFEKD